MPPSVALTLWCVLLLGLLRFDPARRPGISLALWLPVIFLSIAASRLPSVWLSFQGGIAQQALEDGNALDRTIYLGLSVLAIGILMSRSFKLGHLLVRNAALTGFLLFALVSLVWSDFPFIAFKRWVRDLGQYLMMLVVLSDPSPLEAVRAVFRRVAFVLIPLSILLYKYFPQIGKQYEVWTGAQSFVGAATSKNMLGLLCLFSALFFVWDILTRWSDRKQRQTRRVIYVDVVFLAMSAWVLYLSNSATSQVCLVLGCLVLAAAHSKTIDRHPALLTASVPVAVCLYLVMVFGLGFDLNATVAGIVGRDPTLTGRTEIWEVLLRANTNPILGTGYETFWLGPRLQWIWQQVGTINEAHNGYLQVYLHLGLIGVFLLVVFLITSYRNICRRFTSHSEVGRLGLAVWTVLAFYNVSEAAFPTGLLWLMLLPAALVVGERTQEQVARAPAAKERSSQFPTRSGRIATSGFPARHSWQRPADLHGGRRR
jgi:exopolysaccharide production protein ExoQ